MRLNNGLAEYTLRIIVSGSGSIDLAAKIFERRFSSIIVLTTERATKSKLNKSRAVADEVKIFGTRVSDFQEALRWLREKWQVKRPLCESSGELNSALFAAGLVDEMNLTLCPRILGGRIAPTITDGIGVWKSAGSTGLSLTSTKPNQKQTGSSFAMRRNIIPAPKTSL